MRFERDVETLDAYGYVVIEVYTRVTNSSVIAFGDEARKEMHDPVLRANARRIENAPRLVRSIRLRTHDDAKSRDRKVRLRPRKEHLIAPRGFL